MNEITIERKFYYNENHEPCFDIAIEGASKELVDDWIEILLAMATEETRKCEGCGKCFDIHLPFDEGDCDDEESDELIEELLESLDGLMDAITGCRKDINRIDKEVKSLVARVSHDDCK